MKKNNSTTITVIMATIAIITTIGLVSMVANVSALTNLERYNSGWNAAVSIMHDKQALMNTLFSVELNQHHTDPYVNGFVAAVDQGYSLTLPYTDYTTTAITHMGDQTISQPVATFYHQSTALDQ